MKQGLIFGRLTVIAMAPSTSRHPKWTCLCVCGVEKAISASSLQSGSTKSCGCLNREAIAARRTTHGATRGARLPEYGIWCNIKSRCFNEKYDDYPHYGGRGIKVCDRWRESFEAFLADMGRRPSPQHTIEREDNDGDYDPSNCRWATRKEQCRNRRNTRIVEIDGRQMSLAEAVEIKGQKYGRVIDRLRLGWSIERALS